MYYQTLCTDKSYLLKNLHHIRIQTTLVSTMGGVELLGLCCLYTMEAEIDMFVWRPISGPQSVLV